MVWLYGTQNPAKLALMRRFLEGSGVAFTGLPDTPRPIAIEESGPDPLANAKIKASAYYGQYRRPVFSCDSGLYLEGVPDALQPGVHVRRVGNRSLTDEEMVAYYGSLARDMGGRILAQYRNAIALVWGDGHAFSAMTDGMATPSFYLVASPHSPIRPGFPLDSLSLSVADTKDPWAESRQRQSMGFQAAFRQAQSLMKQEVAPCAL